MSCVSKSKQVNKYCNVRQFSSPNSAFFLLPTAATMVLSSCSNWETDVQIVNSEPIHQADHLVASDTQDQNLEYYWDPFDQLSFAFTDPYIELNNNFLLPEPENYTPLHPYEYEPLIPLPTETIPYENFSSYPCTKRQKLVEDEYVMPGFIGGVAVNPCPVLEDQHQVQSLKGTNLQGMKTSVGNCKKNNDEKCVSVQSIAARERRRKITKKTQELGKLVPGGNKMNTAEMLQAAFNYVKYLQAQLGILQLMNSSPDNKEGDCKEMENMQIVTSSKVQEKLYMEEKCLVPKDFVLSLTTDSRPPLSDELIRFLSSS